MRKQDLRSQISCGRLQQLGCACAGLSILEVTGMLFFTQFGIGKCCHLTWTLPTEAMLLWGEGDRLFEAMGEPPKAQAF